MRVLLVGIAAAAVLLYAAPVGAAPSLLGPSGLILTPTATLVGTARFDLGVSAILADERADESILYGTVGLLPGLEVGASHEKPEHQDGETLLHAKLRLFQPPLGRLSVAAGMIDATDQIERMTYVVLSHALGAGVVNEVGPVSLPQIHLGYGDGRFDGLFGGLSLMVNRRIEVMAEYDGDNLNFGARIPLALKLSATIAGLDGADDFAAGLSFSSPW